VLVAREQTGEGQEVRVSMLEAALEMQCTRIAEWLGGGELPAARGSRSAAWAPDRAYAGLDREVFVSVNSESQWRGFCTALERPGLADDPRFGSNVLRMANAVELDAVVEPLIARRPAIWWIRILQRHGVSCCLEQHFETFRYHEQVRSNGMVAAIPTQNWGEISVGGLPWQFAETPCAVWAPPEPGEHTEEILRNLLERG